MVTKDIYTTFDRANFALTFRIHVNAGQRKAFLDLMQKHVAHARQDPGVVGFQLLATEESTRFVLFETFISRAAFAAFIGSKDAAAFMATLADLVASPLTAEFLQPVQGNPLHS